MDEFKQLTGEELIALIKENMSATQFAYGEDGEYDFEDEGVAIFGKSEEVDNHGGYEGSGEERYVVRHFVDHDVYIRLDGYYASYDGSHFDEWGYKVVRPIDRVVRFYE